MSRESIARYAVQIEIETRPHNRCHSARYRGCCGGGTVKGDNIWLKSQENGGKMRYK